MLRTLVGGSTLLLLLLAGGTRVDRLPQGLNATYFADVNWSTAPVRSLVEARPSTDGIRLAWHGAPPDAFSVTWSGSLLVTRAGDYTFETDSDDGAWTYVDGRLVVEEAGRHADLPAFGTVHLERGIHEIFIRYFQDGGDFAFGLRWGIDRGRLEPIPTWALWARRAEFSRMIASALLRRALAWVFWVWAALLLLALAARVRPPLARAAAHLWSDPVRRALAGVIVGSALLNVIGIWWGLPSGWAGDELTPKAVLIALSHRFSFGWFDRYPPLHFYVLTIAYSPWLLVDAMGWVRLPDAQEVTILSVLGRSVSVIAAAGTTIALYVCGARTFGRRAGVWAAAALALLPLFVYYAKTANPEMSYVFWFTAALAFYLRALDTGALRDVLLFSGCAAMSVCTKDQAYALFLSMPVVLACRWQSVADRRLWLGGAVAAALFVAVQNLPLNAHGFVDHLRDITGPGRNYRMFAPTAEGQWGLFATSAALVVRSWGWPLFAASVGGFVIALRTPRLRGAALILALVAAAYYVGFIAVVLYDYDRYLLPIFVVQALFAGVALERATDAATGLGWWRGLAVAALAYSLLYAATVDALMVRDTRYDAEAWLRAHASRTGLVATTFPDVVNPRTEGLRAIDIHTTDDLIRWQPDYFVVNADYARALKPHRPEAALVDGLHDGTLGYRLAYRHRSYAPWTWLPGGHPDLVGPRNDTNPLSFLRDLSPAIEIYERVPRPS
ncbi:MAG TPA: PA14 domain-containing protein [Vicinamibacterales bacterium]|nr:PA14 domain-containing protein [Vicinamibacterales bacterium]